MSGARGPFSRQQRHLSRRESDPLADAWGCGPRFGRLLSHAAAHGEQAGGDQAGRSGRRATHRRAGWTDARTGSGDHQCADSRLLTRW